MFYGSEMLLENLPVLSSPSPYETKSTQGTAWSALEGDVDARGQVSDLWQWAG